LPKEDDRGRIIVAAPARKQNIDDERENFSGLGKKSWKRVLAEVGFIGSVGKDLGSWSRATVVVAYSGGDLGGWGLSLGRGNGRKRLGRRVIAMRGMVGVYREEGGKRFTDSRQIHNTKKGSILKCGGGGGTWGGGVYQGRGRTGGWIVGLFGHIDGLFALMRWGGGEVERDILWEVILK